VRLNNRGEGQQADPFQNEFDLIKHYSHSLIHQNKHMSGRIDGMLPVVHEHFIGKVITGEISDEVAIQLYAEEIDLPFKLDGTMSVISIETLFRAEMYHSLSETDRSFLLIELKHAIQKQLGHSIWACQMSDHILSCIVQLRLYPAGAHEVAEQIMNLSIAYNRYFRTVVSVGDEVGGVTELKTAYLSSMKYLKLKSFSAENEVVGRRLDAKYEESSLYDGYLSREEMNRYINVLRSNDRELFITDIRHHMEQLLAKNVPAMHIYEWARDILNTIYHVAETEQQSDHVVDSYTERLDQLYRSQTLEEMIGFFNDVAGKLVVSASSAAEDKRKLILEAAEYIREHCGEELTLELFAERVQMSLGNFSRTFKEIMGEKYVDYVSRCRIEKAKELLLSTDMKIEEISMAIGYLGRNSFINIFKKFEGITPGKYRQIHGNSEVQQ